jgi:hypothetical protein
LIFSPTHHIENQLFLGFDSVDLNMGFRSRSDTCCDKTPMIGSPAPTLVFLAARAPFSRPEMASSLSVSSISRTMTSADPSESRVSIVLSKGARLPLRATEKAGRHLTRVLSCSKMAILFSASLDGSALLLRPFAPPRLLPRGLNEMRDPTSLSQSSFPMLPLHFRPTGSVAISQEIPCRIGVGYLANALCTGM